MLRRFASHQKKMTLKPQGDLGPDPFASLAHR
jgi:hypothetical protein